MSSEEKKITIKFILTLCTTLSVVWFTAYGYTWIRLGSAESRIENVQRESSEIRTQLSQIQADLAWIKYNLQK